MSIQKNMNKGGGATSGGGGLGGAGSGPTAAAAESGDRHRQHRRQFQPPRQRLQSVNDPPIRNSQEAFMMEMRAARMVQAADSLLKLVSELKQTAIFSGLPPSMTT
ncbi:hypothetical protein C1H46_028303 [Malus baccata]|uniref:Uncharacterized protein n=1 Tax=Malus baccata TaxID=106549 RepID=A0A540LI55_MALBA|nr:hypothetical protein C1H46_028303 [Malus baccata]